MHRITAADGSTFRNHFRFAAWVPGVFVYVGKGGGGGKDLDAETIIHSLEGLSGGLTDALPRLLELWVPSL